MGDFHPLPVYPDNTGNAVTRKYVSTNYHLNRFRISVAPPGGELARYRKIAANLLADMPKYMNPHTAAVNVEARQWEGNETLRFVGVAKVKPFSVPIYNPFTKRWIDLPVPEKLRDWAIPDIHKDWVGVEPGTHTATGFTAQTLKRNFLDASDIEIKTAALAALVALESKSWWNVPLALAELTLEEIASAYVIWVNQHHFLAGRRSFRFADGKDFGYDDGRWVFETAAMERFSLLPYVASEMAMGRAEDVVRPVWVEMVQRVCSQNGLRVIPDAGKHGGWSKDGPVSYVQHRFPAYSAMLGSTEGKTLGKQHLRIHP